MLLRLTLEGMSLRSSVAVCMKTREDDGQYREADMKFCWVTINVSNMEKSLKFYINVVGLVIDRSMKPNPNMEIVFLGNGETKVELIFDTKDDRRNYGNDISIGFEVQSIDKLIEVLKIKNIAVLSGPHQPNPMIKFIYVLDPDGLKVQFVENIRKDAPGKA